MIVLPSHALLGRTVDFSIHYLKEYELFGHKLYITTTHVSIAIVMLIILIFAVCANIAIRKADPYKKPGKFLNLVELLVETLDGITINGMGKTYGYKYRNYIGSLFIFLFVANLSGLLGLRPPTADYAVTFSLAMISFVIIHYAGFKYQKLGHITDLFKPLLLTPINIIGEIATPLSMSLRLFGNILSGTVLMSLVYGLLPKALTYIVPGFLHAYLDVFSGVIQAYVFTMLTMVFTAQNFDVEE
ncbi:MAG: F0F1 ATP synthase subunit A [Lachnospiraceae bacterium]|nr:F0F1 ATP synthase subunit A [Lachnospiraceae bacterium]